MSFHNRFSVDEKRRLSKRRWLAPRIDESMIRIGALVTFVMLFREAYVLPWWWVLLFSAAFTFSLGLALVLFGRKALHLYLIHIYR